MLYFSVSLKLKSSSNNIDKEKKHTKFRVAIYQNLNQVKRKQHGIERRKKMVCLHNWNPYLKTTNTVKVLNINWTVSLKMIIIIIMRINEKNLVFKKKQNYDELFKNTNVNLWLALNTKKKCVKRKITASIITITLK